MKATLVFTRNGGEQKLELSGHTLTIGRGTDCELQIADDRVSTRHCCLLARDGEWLIQDLKSTNRTFVNGEPLEDRPRRLMHGDFLRLGAHDARLFEAQFVTRERPPERRDAPPSADGALLKRIAELEAALAARDAELARIGGMYKRLQIELADHNTAAVSARQASAMMTREIERLGDELALLRADHAGCALDVDRARRRTAELEAQLDAQQRKAAAERDDTNRTRKDLESRLSVAASELALTRTALATATDNIRTLKEAYDDVAARLGDGKPSD